MTTKQTFETNTRESSPKALLTLGLAALLISGFVGACTPNNNRAKKKEEAAAAAAKEAEKVKTLEEQAKKSEADHIQKTTEIKNKTALIQSEKERSTQTTAKEVEKLQGQITTLETQIKNGGATNPAAGNTSDSTGSAVPTTNALSSWKPEDLLFKNGIPGGCLAELRTEKVNGTERKILALQAVTGSDKGAQGKIEEFKVTLTDSLLASLEKSNSTALNEQQKVRTKSTAGVTRIVGSNYHRVTSSNFIYTNQILSVPSDITTDADLSKTESTPKETEALDKLKAEVTANKKPAPSLGSFSGFALIYTKSDKQTLGFKIYKLSRLFSPTDLRSKFGNTKPEALSQGVDYEEVLYCTKTAQK